MRKFLFLLLAVTLALTSRAQQPRMKKIFNGRDFRGWTVPRDNVWWTAGKGILIAKSSEGKKGSILWTSRKYRDFIVQADFLMGDGVVDSGIFLRSENDQIQIGISGSLKRDLTASPYIPGMGYPVEANVRDILRPKDWNTMRIRVTGNTYSVWLNEVAVMTYTSTKMAAEGPVGLQLHPGNEMTVSYRNIRLAVL